MHDLMNTREVADYLRIKERKVYDLVRTKRIPCTRVTGKWLFPKQLIDQWVAQASAYPVSARSRPTPSTVVGSHDPLLEWAVRESGSELAIMAGGSLDGLRRMAAGEAAMCGLHVLDGDTDTYNVPVVAEFCKGLDAVLVEWAWRDQGLVLAAGNPLGIRSLEDLKLRKARVITRQHEAGSQLLLVHLLSAADIRLGDLDVATHPARSETDLAFAVLEGKADAGIAVAAVARQFRLDFIPIKRERYDLLIRRREYFEPSVQRLLTFARSPSFQSRASEMAGYDTSGIGNVVYNVP